MAVKHSRLRTVGRAIACTLLMGLAAPAAFAGSWQKNVSIGGFNKVHIYSPDTQSALGEKALLVVLHGCTQPIDAFLTANLEDAAEEHGMVIAVPDAMHKAGFSCWSYWEGAKSRTSGDYKNLINLANTMTGDPARGIDPNQVYIAGLSSGAAFAAQAGCVAPDVFAGVAPSAGPTIGTSSGGAISTCESVSTSQFKSRCESYAGSYRSHLDTQLAVVGHGTSDSTVNSCYNEQNAKGFATVYGVSKLSGTKTVGAGGNTAEEHLWEDGRVAMLWLNGLDHSWSGGQGASGSYVAGKSINFASYLGEHFAQYNARVDRNQGPEISNLAATPVNNALDISGTAVDAEGSVSEVAISITKIDTTNPEEVASLTTSVNASNQFAITSASLLDGLYEVEAVATDNEDKAGETASVTVRVGPPPADEAPTLSNISASTNGQCATVSGSVVDVNQNLSSVSVEFANGTVGATVDGTSFSAEKCDLPGGTNTATVTATDSTNLSNTDSVSFEVDAGKTGDYNYHIAEGHITWGDGYSACYLEFGADPFTMRETSAGGGQCEWVADGAPSCNGPVQACSTSGGGGDPEPEPEPEPEPQPNDCEQVSAYNYYHKTGGRAYSTGSSWSPSYFANGTDQAMSGSTWGYNTLHSTNGTDWSVGACP
ncbi:PHB depolymerase family esterase [Alkalilimnicola sp. S0819]|uniref:extracellular catalytic domain type 1 short-chain-length polyhydroxyalkanoate depolymerase n=1 Tax=Alkalilimnicola sp. S0819 TaxID=2613922 RepID=UPI0012619FE3|nr:PHB depolymerase family esterase [Alkalilimnicola sp. S0819]KAB7628446.1 PHB depolymerase family esterase [Alkalilimnicola sp. S0819]MPQ15350.1 PHB depolymerase family esterase [Alkalilimnicola sp. S0819]